MITITRNGITWTLDRSGTLNDGVTNGTYVNGRPWVKIPFSVTAINPVPTAEHNGTMWNPAGGATQAFDIFPGNPYTSENQPAGNAGLSLPWSVSTEGSIISSDTSEISTQFNTALMFSILTAVAVAPAVGDFAPPYIGSGSRASIANESNINYARLANHAHTGIAQIPNMATLNVGFSKDWFELDLNWTGRYLHPSYMGLSTGYGRDIALQTGDACLALQLAYTNAQKRDLLINIVQLGIDIYGMIQTGGTWYADGGHNYGRLSPLIVAAGVLNHSGMKTALGSYLFSEMHATFYVSAGEVGTQTPPRVGQNGDLPHDYITGEIGMPEWGIRHYLLPHWDNNFWLASYRDIGGSCLPAPVIVALSMGMRGLLNHEAMFDYCARHVDYFNSPGYLGEFNSNPVIPFHGSMYANFRGYSAEILPTMSPSYLDMPMIINSGRTVTINTHGADACYYAFGSIPTSANTPYTFPVAVNSSSTLNVVNYVDGFPNTPVSQVFSVITNGTPAPPRISL